jgi:hypothetical protein
LLLALGKGVGVETPAELGLSRRLAAQDLYEQPLSPSEMISHTCLKSRLVLSTTSLDSSMMENRRRRVAGAQMLTGVSGGQSTALVFLTNIASACHSICFSFVTI